ncbi:hypothetical protein HB162lentus_26250 [Mammaliicoccus lentus]|uniref:hypothetical protein n=1 Tax=Mammaliicoccus TaxID=2803850 RepID=UPI0010725C90|nr:MULTISPECIES: hypothetical protein [Mammaliicoccus]MBF0795843.1 hypothetical protein [Mammaliicoccus lentus]MBW0768792.1 hypothetical protein [Mammaliicoccus lentus]TFV13536.1 hypothetical protein E4T78_14610 [Mammaliicoccus lentus]
MKYFEYWRRTFDYKGQSQLTDLFICIGINILILAFIFIFALLGPLTWENALVNLYYICLVLMLFPTASLLVRVIKNNKKTNNQLK